MTESLGFTHIMNSISSNAWESGLYHRVSEKPPADLIAEIFGSVSTNVKNLKIEKTNFGVSFSHSDEPLDGNDFRRLLHWHNTDVITDNTIRPGSRTGVGARSVVAFYSNKDIQSDTINTEWFINDGWMNCGLIISKINKPLIIKDTVNNNYNFDKENEYCIIGLLKLKKGTACFVQSINNLKNNKKLKEHLKKNINNNVFFILPELIKQNDEFHNFYKKNDKEIIENLRFIFSFFDCSFEMNGFDIFKDKPGKLIDLEGDKWPAMEYESIVYERKKDKVKCVKTTIKKHTLCHDISGNNTYYFDLPSKNQQKDRFGSTKESHMTKLSLNDWKQKEPWSEEDFKDSKIIYNNVVQMHARTAKGNKDYIKYYGSSVISPGLVRVDEQDILYAKKFRKGTTGSSMPYYLKGQRTDGAGCRKLLDNKYKFKDGQRFQGLVREDKTNENSIYNTNPNRMSTNIKTRGETQGYETLLPYIANCMWRSHCAVITGKTEKKAKELTPEEKISKIAEDALKLAKQKEQEAEDAKKRAQKAEREREEEETRRKEEERKRKAAEANAQANKIAKEEADAQAKANAKAATKAQNEANYTKKKAADMELKVTELNQDKQSLTAEVQDLKMESVAQNEIIRNLENVEPEYDDDEILYKREPTEKTKYNLWLRDFSFTDNEGKRHQSAYGKCLICPAVISVAPLFKRRRNGCLSLSAGHVIPHTPKKDREGKDIHKGGFQVLNNFIPLCGGCNSSMSNTDCRVYMRRLIKDAESTGMPPPFDKDKVNEIYGPIWKNLHEDYKNLRHEEYYLKNHLI